MPSYRTNSIFSPSALDSTREIVERDNLGFLSWGTLDKGILTGRVTPQRTFDDADARSWAPWWKHDDRTPKYHAMEKIAALLSVTDYSALELALGYVLQFKEVSAALCGIRNTEQLTTALNALTHLPHKDILDEAKSIADETVASYRRDKRAGRHPTACKSLLRRSDRHLTVSR